MFMIFMAKIKKIKQIDGVKKKIVEFITFI